MPMIDVYATTGTFADTSQLAADLAGPLVQRRDPRAVRAMRSHYETPGACGGR